MISTNRCSRCGYSAAFERRSSGDYLCRKCFLVFFEKRVGKTVRTNKLLSGTDKTAVALSGGKDSAAALCTLKKISTKAPGASLIALGIDAGINGFGKKSLDASRKLCRELDVELHVYSFKEEFGYTMDEVYRKTRELESPAPACSYCGVLRRKLLNDKARELNAGRIATGHNLDDEIQAGLMNYIRGDYDRMARMGALVGVVRDPAFIPRIKPLRDCPEEEVRLYADLQGIDYVAGRCPYSGEAFRGTVRKMIEGVDEEYSGIRFQMLKSTDRLIDILRKNVKAEKMGKCAECGQPTSGNVCKFCEVIKELDLAPASSTQAGHKQPE
ncbi:MAG: TIGR00269 family protein [Candidatus Altiarchaeota archaeon]|nr:TIGR00269 family protein [Candidatus Altiarchaeota archaeon]